MNPELRFLARLAETSSGAKIAENKCVKKLTSSISNGTFWNIFPTVGVERRFGYRRRQLKRSLPKVTPGQLNKQNFETSGPESTVFITSDNIILKF